MVRLITHAYFSADFKGEVDCAKNKQKNYNENSQTIIPCLSQNNNPNVSNITINQVKIDAPQQNKPFSMKFEDIKFEDYKIIADKM